MVGQFQDVVDKFDTTLGFPQAAGAIDGTHIPIKAPEEAKEDYFNRKHFYSVVLQAVVDADGRFIDTNVGRPGSVHDARVFALSSVKKRLAEGILFNPSPTREINGIDIPLALLGDPAYPLLPGLLKGYTAHQNLTRQQRVFNNRLSRARFVVEHAFGRLKGRWRILNKKNDLHLSFMRTLVQTCCTLHNICESNGDPFRAAWMYGVENNVPVNHNNQRPRADSSRIREALKQYFTIH
ncbi:uncharacterized protein [Diadema antillarum]|uniref:uncharacterized protein n=1 Tax=Diadema antillarum TaxID=105358 RepID=UPI003A86A683